MTEVLEYLPSEHPIHRINPTILARLRRAQQNLVANAFGSAEEICVQACKDVGVDPKLARHLKGVGLFPFVDLPVAAIQRRLTPIATDMGLPPQAATDVAVRVQLLRAFEEPNAVLEMVRERIKAVVLHLPKTAADIEEGTNPADVLDPFITAAAQELMYGGSMVGTIEAIVSHKAFMKIEDMVGHLHEDVIGRMRGNIRGPEPRGAGAAELDLKANPFPGADVIQPPWNNRTSIRFHQVKNKTGSAKGGDGVRLGNQLRTLRQTYGGEAYYDALIGRTLQGHRSMAGVLQAEPEAVVLVGQSAFQALTGGPNGAEILMRLYQAAIQEIAGTAGYDIRAIATSIAAEFRARAEAQGSDYLYVLLQDVTGGDTTIQDSRSYTRRVRRRAGPAPGNGH